MSLPTVTLTGTAVNPDGTPVAGRLVSLTLQVPMLDAADEILVNPSTVTITLDDSGSFSQVMVPSDAGGLAPTPVAYLVRELFGDDRSYYVLIPSADPTVDLWADLAPVGTAPDPPSAYLLAPTGSAAVGDVPVVSGTSPLVTEWGTTSAPVQSVNGRTGAVVLAATDVGADTAGAAATAQATAEAYTDTQIGARITLTDNGNGTATLVVS